MKYFLVKEAKKKTSLQIKETNYELRAYGLFLSEEDILYLKEQQKIAYELSHMIDVSYDIIFTIANTFKASPYIRYDSFKELIKDVLFLYYAYRRKTKYELYDDQVIELMYEAYLQCNGSINKDLLEHIIKTGGTYE